MLPNAENIRPTTHGFLAAIDAREKLRAAAMPIDRAFASRKSPRAELPCEMEQPFDYSAPNGRCKEINVICS